jgi:Fe-S cluster assembly ATP-binding protein
VLEVKDLQARVAATGVEVLKGVNLVVREGETAAIMGKNGSGKSTLSKVLVGHPDYEVTAGTVTYKRENLLAMEPEERARAGLFMSFQAPIEVPGVNNVDFLRMAANARRKAQGKEEFEPLDFYMHLSPKVCIRMGSLRACLLARKLTPHNVNSISFTEYLC